MRGSCFALAATSCQSWIPPLPYTSMCERTDNIRSRTSFWNPFMTESTTISAATPSAMPATDSAAMNDMKPLRWPAPRPLRV
jgi:hypothetical protein